MIGYRQHYRPAFAMAQAPATTAAPSVTPTSSLTTTQRHMAIALGSAETLFGALATWVGVRAGLREKGVFSALGWAVAAGGGLFAMVNLLGTVGMINEKA